MIETREQLSNCIELERALWIERNYPNGRPKHIFRKELLFVKALRYNEYYSAKLRGGYVWKIIYKLLSNLYNVAIPCDCFEEGLLIAHLQNIVVSRGARIGKFCCLYHNTTIGIKMGQNENGKCPKIGDGVTFCAGSCAFGDIEIGDGILIGANAAVTRTISKNNVVIGGIPAVVIGEHPGFSMIDFAQSVMKKMETKN